MKHFVWVNEQQQGPFDEETIQLMLSDKQISSESLICPEDGTSDWRAVSEVFGQPFCEEAIAAGKSNVDFAEPENPADKPDDGTRLRIKMSSGSELSIKAVQLYDENVINKLNAKKAEAVKMFQGVSTGLGAIGSIEWVLATSIVIGATEAILSAGASSVGKQVLEDALYLDKKLRMEGVFIPVSSIKEIETPILGHWQAPYVKKGTFMGINNKPVVKLTQGTYVHNGDDFISVKIDDDSVCSIRWSSVERCSVSKPV